MKARIERDADGVHRIYAQRAKYKHWFELGTHKDTTNLFYRRYSTGDIVWEKDIKTINTLFKK